jgi:hypothetical protein
MAAAAQAALAIRVVRGNWPHNHPLRLLPPCACAACAMGIKQPIGAACVGCRVRYSGRADAVVPTSAAAARRPEAADQHRGGAPQDAGPALRDCMLPQHRGGVAQQDVRAEPSRRALTAAGASADARARSARSEKDLDNVLQSTTVYTNVSKARLRAAWACACANERALAHAYAPRLARRASSPTRRTCRRCLAPPTRPKSASWRARSAARSQAHVTPRSARG